jgi:hypothetical protein
MRIDLTPDSARWTEEESENPCQRGVFANISNNSTLARIDPGSRERDVVGPRRQVAVSDNHRYGIDIGRRDPFCLRRIRPCLPVIVIRDHNVVTLRMADIRRHRHEHTVQGRTRGDLLQSDPWKPLLLADLQAADKPGCSWESCWKDWSSFFVRPDIAANGLNPYEIRFCSSAVVHTHVFRLHWSASPF